jgi:hypothetical protein
VLKQAALYMERQKRATKEVLALRSPEVSPGRRP